MSLHPRLALFFALALALGLASAARADIPPMDRCDGAEGSACTNAAPSYTGAGVCTKTTCTRTLPPMGGGQPMQTSYVSVPLRAPGRDDGWGVQRGHVDARAELLGAHLRRSTRWVDRL